jgi:hypothetical protein
MTKKSAENRLKTVRSVSQNLPKNVHEPQLICRKTLKIVSLQLLENGENCPPKAAKKFDRNGTQVSVSNKLSAQKREKSLAENYEKMSAETGEQPSTSYKLSAETGEKVRRKLVKIVEGCLSKMAKSLLKR